MSSTSRIALIVLGVLIIGLGGSYALSIWFQTEDWLPIGVSIASLTIAILAAFKNELLDFHPTAIEGGFGLIHSSQGNANKSGVLLPLHFFNRGYGEGVVLSVGLEATYDGKNETYLLTPAAEVDLRLLMQNTGRIHGSNIIGPFMSFPLESKQVVSKSIAFNWASEDPSYAKPYLGPGNYEFRLLVLTDRSSKPIELLKFIQKFDQNTIDTFNAGNAIFNMKGGPWNTPAEELEVPSNETPAS